MSCKYHFDRLGCEAGTGYTILCSHQFLGHKLVTNNIPTEDSNPSYTLL